jgi:hypothetical protein
VMAGHVLSTSLLRGGKTRGRLLTTTGIRI